MKKLLLSLGAVAAVVAPVATVVACGNDDDSTTTSKVEVTYNSAADGTRTAELDFGSETATQANLKTALAEVEDKVRADLDSPSYSGTTVTVTLKSDKAEDVVVNADFASLADKEAAVTAAMTTIVMSTDVNTSDGWSDCFDAAATK